MNCEKCQELMSDLLDGTPPAERRAEMNAHLDGCFGCASVREELQAIIGVAHESRAALAAPPNERALWLRIRNSIEAEAAASAAAAARAAASTAPARESFWSRLAHRRFVLSLPQAATATAGVAVAVALVTVFGMRSLVAERAADEVRPAARTAARGFGQNPDVLMIEYLKQRVDERKARWDPRMRRAYEQNLSVIDQTVSEMLQDLDRRPHDEVSEKALNAAMRDKIELLKDFSEL